MSAPEITLERIREYAEGKSYQRGEEYYETGMVESVTLRGDTFYAAVQGSDEEPYQVTVTSGPSNSLLAVLHGRVRQGDPTGDNIGVIGLLPRHPRVLMPRDIIEP